MASRDPTLRELLFGAESGLVDPPGLRADPSNFVPQSFPTTPSLTTELLQTLLEHGPAVYIIDHAGEFIFRNSAFDIILKNPDFSKVILLDTVAELRRDDAEIQRSLQLGDGAEARHYRARHFPLRNAKGHVVAYGGVLEEVTATTRARQKAQELGSWLDDIVRSTSDWVWVTDRDGRVKSISRRISEILGSPAENLVGRPFFELGTFDDTDAFSSKTPDDIRHWRAFRSRRFLMKPPDGTVRHVHLSGVPQFDDMSGEFLGYRGTGTDASARHASEIHMQTARESLERMNSELQTKYDELLISFEHLELEGGSSFDALATMSHEIKTPLNSIIGFSDAALQNIHGPISGAYTKYFENIHRAGQHLLAIINDLLESSHLEQNKTGIKTKETPLQPLIDDAVNMVSANGQTDGLDLSPLSVKTDLVARCDGVRVRQILVNLLNNAVKFTPDHGRVGIDVETRGDDKVAITVWDTGLGIPSEKQELIFEKFYQLDQSVLQRGTAGTGLGLNISRCLARLMGGDLTVASVPGKGSRFTLTLPGKSFFKEP